VKQKYRIRREGLNEFVIQQRFLWFWVTVTEYPFWTVDEARKAIESWGANDAVRGMIYEP
jgi:hypothetical protein